MMHDEVKDWMACRDWLGSKIGLYNTLRIVRDQISEENAQNLHLWVSISFLPLRTSAVS